MEKEKTLTEEKTFTKEELNELVEKDLTLYNILIELKEQYRNLAVQNIISERSGMIFAAYQLLDKAACLLMLCPEHSSRALLASMICTDKYGETLPELKSFDEMTEFINPKNVERLLSGITSHL